MEVENPELLPKVRSAALRQAIRGMPCSLRISSIIGRECAARSTVVPCHLPTIGRGISTKVTDLAVAAGCHHCHDLLDMRRWRTFTHSETAEITGRLLHALVETQARLVMAGIIEVRGAEILK